MYPLATETRGKVSSHKQTLIHRYIRKVYAQIQQFCPTELISKMLWVYMCDCGHHASSGAIYKIMCITPTHTLFRGWNKKIKAVTEEITDDILKELGNLWLVYRECMRSKNLMQNMSSRVYKLSMKVSFHSRITCFCTPANYKHTIRQNSGCFSQYRECTALLLTHFML
jgi:hypothetical protein